MSALRACREGQELLHRWSLVGQSVLELDAHNVQQLLAYILQRVRAQRLCPDCCGRCAASGLSRIRKDPTVRITPHEIGPGEYVIDAWQAMSMDWNGVSWLNACVQDPHTVILKQHTVVIRCCNDGIQLVWPVRSA